jgi:hypothetical protein
VLYPVSAESDAKRTSADMEKGETGKETMDLFPQIAGFGSEAATKEAPDARYTSLFCWVSVHSHSHVMLAWYYCCSQLMTENVKKKNNLPAVRSSSWWPVFYLSNSCASD